MKKKILVTGGAGFIGSHLVDRLLELGDDVAVVDDFSLGKKENLIQHKDNPKLIVYKKSICEDLSDILKDTEIVFHLAALPRVQFSIKNPIQAHNVNVEGTLNLLYLSKECGVRRFIFSSSSSVYGDQEELPFKETMHPNPMSPYALHKLTSEYYCKLFNLHYGLETIALRYFNVFGPRQDPNSDYACLIPKFIRLVYNDIRPTINGDGEQTRDFTYVKDTVEATIAFGFIENKKLFGEVFNVGCGRNISVNQVTKSITNLTNRNIEPIYGDSVIEPRHTLADTTKLKGLIGWEPKFSFEEGLKETFNYFKKQMI